MGNKPTPTYDAFTFSLGGLRAISSTLNARAIAGERLNKAIAKELARRASDEPLEEGRARRLNRRFRLPKLLRAR